MSGNTIPLKRTAGTMPPGIYRCVIAAVDPQPPGPSGYPYLKLELVVYEKDKASPKFAYNDRRLWTNCSLSPNARWKMEELLDAVGAPEDGQIDFDYLLKKVVFAKVIEGEFEGKVRAQVDVLIARSNVAKELAAEAEAMAQAASKPKPAPIIETDDIEPIGEQEDAAISEIADSLWD